MTYENLESGLLILALVVIGLGLWLAVGAIVKIKQADARRDEAWRKFKWGDWV